MRRSSRIPRRRRDSSLSRRPSYSASHCSSGYAIPNTSLGRAGGLYSFVEAAAGRRVALLQAALWIFSYLLYLVYTTASIVYDMLPAVLPGVRPYRPFLEIAIPVAMAGIMVAGRTIALAVLGALAAAQVVLVGALAAVTLGHDAPIMAFGIHPAGPAIGSGTGMISLLYICGSLPLFLGGEVAQPSRTIRRGMTAGYLLVAAGVTVSVFPLAANPAFTRAEIPGMAVAQQFSGHALAVAVGTGVAASTAGVMMVEYLALSRLLHAITGLPVRSIVVALGIVMVAAAPFSLTNPDRFYDSLIRPSLIALWLSQLIVFAAYPRFAVKRGGQRLAAWLLAGGASAFALYGLYTTIHHPGS